MRWHVEAHGAHVGVLLPNQANLSSDLGQEPMSCGEPVDASGIPLCWQAGCPLVKLMTHSFALLGLTLASKPEGLCGLLLLHRHALLASCLER